MVFDNFSFSNKPIKIDRGKYNFIPIFYFGNYSTAQDQILKFNQTINGNKLELIFSNEKQDLSLGVLGQPFMTVYVPKKCEFYIRVIEKKANSKI